MPDGLYERDALAWAEQQAGLLRRVAAGERLNEAVDWANVIEEVQDVGLSELRACRSLLRQALMHLFKLHLSPGAEAADHWASEAWASEAWASEAWASEAAGFLADARDRFAPSMRQLLDMQDIFADVLNAISGTRAHGDGRADPRGPLARECPFTLDDLLSGRPDIDGLVVRLGALAHGGS